MADDGIWGHNEAAERILEQLEVVIFIIDSCFKQLSQEAAVQELQTAILEQQITMLQAYFESIENLTLYMMELGDEVSEMFKVPAPQGSPKIMHCDDKCKELTRTVMTEMQEKADHICRVTFEFKDLFHKLNNR